MTDISPVLQQNSGLMATDGLLSPEEQARRLALVMTLLGRGQAQQGFPAPVPSINRQQDSSRPERPKVGGGDIGALLSVMGGPAAVPGIIGSLVTSEAMGRRPDPSLLSLGGGMRLIRDGNQGRALSASDARSINRRAEREDRSANRSLREGRGSGASPRRGDVSNAGR